MLFIIHILNLISFSIGSYSIKLFPDPVDSNLEAKLIQEMINGNKESRAILIEHNLRLVAHIVKKFETLEKNTDDLISIGTIGLIKGIDSFKPEKNNRITTYCARCIENEILMYFRSNKKNNNNVSLNDVIGSDSEGNEICLIDVVKADHKDLINELNTEINIKYLKESLSLLSTQEKDIIIKRYGLNNNKPLTQKEIGDLLGISRSYVSRIEKKALNKIYKYFKKNKIEL